MATDRRQFMRGLAGTATMAIFPGWALSAQITPRQPAGPFYPEDLPLDDDNDLVHVAGQKRPARGLATDLTGRLLDLNGHALGETRIEIWQCDTNGRYRHPRDPGRQAIDPGFQGFGHTYTDKEGRYRFLTIKPVPYPGRTPHIHVAVYPRGERPFVTQLYVREESRNEDDFLFRRIPTESRPLVTASFLTSAEPGSPLRASWDIILGVSRT